MVQVTSDQVRRMALMIKAEAEELAEDQNFTDPYQSIMAALLIQMGKGKGGAVYAAKRDKSLHDALAFLKFALLSDCEVCLEKVPEEELDRNALLPCKHTACAGCLKKHFQDQARHGKLSCTSCRSDIPQAENLHLLKRVFGNKYEEFNDKLLTCKLEVASDIKHCVNEKCDMLWSVPENLTKMRCPSCKALGCARCGNKWQKEHEGKTCDEFKKWKSENDPDDPEFKSQALIRKDAHECPSCKTPFFKAKGGCAHFTCLKCKNQFCECCKTQFVRGQECGNPGCAKMGMHGHHPRNCFFYTRDMPIDKLIGLLKEKAIAVDEQGPTGPGSTKCSVNITNDDFQDSECGVPVHKAGKCEKHYKEMVCDLIAHNNVDTVSIMNERQLVQELEKNGKPLPIFTNETEVTKVACLQKAVVDAVPLQGARN